MNNKKNEKVTLKNIVAYEKAQMLPLNFTISYILAPIYIVISVAILVAFGVLMSIDDEKFFAAGVSLLGGFVLLSVVFLSCVPFVRKKAIKHELHRYDFNTSNISPLELWDFSTDEFQLKFDKHGMYVFDELFYYNHLQKLIVTNNRCNRINIYIQFSLSKEQNVTLPINPKTLKMLEYLNIRLDIQYILDYILSNKEKAFEQIYNKGYVTVR